MHDLIVQFGPVVMGAVFTALTAALTRYVLVKIESNLIREGLGRLWSEVQAAVREVGQTYVDAIREGAADGKLTDAEKKEAKKRAVEIAKSNFGRKGLKALARIIDVDAWLGSKVEAFLGETKAAEKLIAPALPKSAA